MQQCKQTTSHGLVLRVYASQWNWACTAFEHVETKTEEVVFSLISCLSFIVGIRSELVWSYDRHLPAVVPWLNFTPDPQQVQAERFSSSSKFIATSEIPSHIDLGLRLWSIKYALRQIQTAFPWSWWISGQNLISKHPDKGRKRRVEKSFVLSGASGKAPKNLGNMRPMKPWKGGHVSRLYVSCLCLDVFVNKPAFSRCTKNLHILYSYTNLYSYTSLSTTNLLSYLYKFVNHTTHIQWPANASVSYSTVGCRRTWGRRSQPRSFLFFTTPANLVLIFRSVFESHNIAQHVDSTRYSISILHTQATHAGPRKGLKCFDPSAWSRFKVSNAAEERLSSQQTLFACSETVPIFQPGVVLIFRWNSSLAVLRQTVLRHRQYCTCIWASDQQFCNYIQFCLPLALEQLVEGPHSQDMVEADHL